MSFPTNLRSALPRAAAGEAGTRPGVRQKSGAANRRSNCAELKVQMRGPMSATWTWACFMMTGFKARHVGLQAWVANCGRRQGAVDTYLRGEAFSGRCPVRLPCVPCVPAMTRRGA